MTETEAAPYPILEIQPDWVREPEAMGNKDKFWFRESNGPDWLCKFPQPNLGQYWAEKIAAEVADACPGRLRRVRTASGPGSPS
jgi:hypothetical protein